MRKCGNCIDSTRLFSWTSTTSSSIPTYPPSPLGSTCQDWWHSNTAIHAHSTEHSVVRPLLDFSWKKSIIAWHLWWMCRLVDALLARFILSILNNILLLLFIPCTMLLHQRNYRCAKVHVGTYPHCCVLCHIIHWLNRRCSHGIIAHGNVFCHEKCLKVFHLFH